MRHLLTLLIVVLATGCVHREREVSSPVEEPSFRLNDGTPVVIRSCSISMDELHAALEWATGVAELDAYEGLEIKQTSDETLLITFDRVVAPDGTVMEDARIEISCGQAGS